jgi:hypothetical protein
MLFTRGEFPSSAQSRAAKWLQGKEDIETRFQDCILGEHLDEIAQRDNTVAECAHDQGTGEYLGTLVAEGLSAAQMVAYRLLAGESVDMTEETAKLSEIRQELPEDFDYESIPHRTKLGAYKHFWLRPEPAEQPAEETAEQQQEEDDLPF